jgi:hypothetical protein
VYSEEEIAKQREELEMADTTEKELWVSYAMRLGKAITYLVADGTPAAVTDKFFGVVPDSRPLEGCPPFCGKRPPVWSSSKLHGYCNKGITHLFIKLYTAHVVILFSLIRN